MNNAYNYKGTVSLFVRQSLSFLSIIYDTLNDLK